jgi:hypothetical protein
LSYEPNNADIYGQLGIIYFRSRNYEGAIDTLKCAIYGCSGEASCIGRGLERCFPNLGENPVDVQGLKISPNTIVYYYTYGSVVAALSRPLSNHCDEAMKTMGEVRAELEANPEDYADARDTILSIVEDGEFICKSLTEGNSSPDTTIPTPTGEAATTLDVTPTLEAPVTPTP